jgi:hypothetical protein
MTERKTTMRRKYDGSLLSDHEKVLLAARVSPTNHALERINERCPGLDIMKSILESPLVYWNEHGYIVVALPEGKSMIIAHDYALVTVRNASCHLYSNADRWLLTRWYGTIGHIKKRRLR